MSVIGRRASAKYRYQLENWHISRSVLCRLHKTLPSDTCQYILYTHLKGVRMVDCLSEALLQ